jgi:hypothetical protein
MSLSSLIRRTNAALSSSSLSPEDRLDIYDRALHDLSLLEPTDAQAYARLTFLQGRAATLDLCDTRADLEDDTHYDPNYDDADWDTAALYDGPVGRSLAHLL